MSKREKNTLLLFLIPFAIPVTFLCGIFHRIDTMNVNEIIWIIFVDAIERRFSCYANKWIINAFNSHRTNSILDTFFEIFIFTSYEFHSFSNSRCHFLPSFPLILRISVVNTASLKHHFGYQRVQLTSMRLHSCFSFDDDAHFTKHNFLQYFSLYYGRPGTSFRHSSIFSINKLAKNSRYTKYIIIHSTMCANWRCNFLLLHIRFTKRFEYRDFHFSSNFIALKCTHTVNLMDDCWCCNAHFLFNCNFKEILWPQANSPCHVHHVYICVMVMDQARFFCCCCFPARVKCNLIMRKCKMNGQMTAIQAATTILLTIFVVFSAIAVFHEGD